MHQKRRKPLTVASPFGLVFVPLLLVVGCLSIPVVAIQRQLGRRRHNRLLSEMGSRGRIVTVRQIEEQMVQGGGTLIVERGFPKGPVRRWWTPEDIYMLCPYSLGSPISQFESSPFRDAIDWCRERYTDALQGTAALIVDGPIAQLIATDHLRLFEIPVRRR